ncbi:hypothetical protein BU17DRAFT_56821 [Hysterangium stoloniferum]|nr:hypothetical protein BU17DRAFT_56821 [Hysterangium stoloniferum]
MLVRSRTEPTLPSPATSSPPNSVLKASLSLSTIGSIPTPNKPQQLLLHQSPQSLSPVASRPTLRTYSQSRSFLVPLPASMAARPSSSPGLPVIRDTASQHDDEEVRESYSDLRARWGVDNSEDDPSHISGQTNDLLSITELRSKGESRRFLDEVGYLFEGLEEQGLAASVRRSSAAEIVTKMCDPEFVRMAKAANFIGHAWDSMREAGAGDGDKVLDLYLIAFVALVARDKRDLDDLSHRNGFFDTMLRMLLYSKKIDGFCIEGDVEARKAGFSKSEWIAVSNLRHTMVTKSGLMASYAVPSTRWFASYTLSRIAPIVYPQRLLPTLLETLIGELQLLRPKSGVEIPSITADLDHIDHCLVILDACLLGSSGPKYVRNQLGAVQRSLCSGLAKLCVTLQTISPDSEQGDAVCRCMEDALRVLISLSHVSPGWCEHLVEDPALLHILVCQIISVSSAVMKQDPDEVDDKTPSLDLQCLALALLSNLLFVVGDAKDRLRDISLSVTCTGRQHCALSCHCAQRVNAITTLMTLFVEMAIKSESSVRAFNFVKYCKFTTFNLHRHRVYRS